MLDCPHEYFHSAINRLTSICTIASKINVTAKGVYLHFEAKLNFSHSEFNCL